MKTVSASGDHKSRPIHREMARCQTCTAWWSVRWGIGPTWDGKDVARCSCGGDLELADMEAHKATLPYVPMLPVTPAK